jgi:CRISPR-associated protein Csm2
MGQRNPQQTAYRPNEQHIREIIQEAEAYRLLVTTADELGRHLVDVGLKTTQIRNIFGVARQLQAKWVQSEDEAVHIRLQRRLALLQPKLAYQKKRERAVTPLADTLEMSIDMVFEESPSKENPSPEMIHARFIRFMEFFEAILAYHTAYGGRTQ